MYKLRLYISFVKKHIAELKKNMKEIWSRYNFLVKDKDNRFLLYNSYTNNLFEFNGQENYNDLLKVKNGKIEKISADFLEELKANLILVEDDNLLAQKIKLARLSTRFTSTRMNLTLAPTVSCNFACPYCYEEINEKKGTMNEDTENDIISLIKSYKGLERLNVDWYGGEPLIAFDVLVRLTKKIQELSLKEYRAILITNGYLLNEQKSSQLKSLGINRIQITIDGLEETHNKRRPHRVNHDSFKMIVNNLRRLYEVYPEVETNIRVNIDKDNADDFFKLNEYLHEIIKNVNLCIYPAYVTEFNPCKETFCMMNRVEQANFVLANNNKYPFGAFYYPSTRLGECSARFMNSFIVGPKGELYKCWCDVGDENKIVGNLKQGITNSELYTRYMTELDPLCDTRCIDCSYFPICSGGCAFRRLKNKNTPGMDNLCTIQKDNMSKFIKLYDKSINRH